MQLYTQELEEQLLALSTEERKQYIFLENHHSMEHHWKVEGFDPGFIQHFEGVLNSKRVLSPFAYPFFQERAEAEGLKIVFLDDPKPVFEWAESLSELPEVVVQSVQPGTVNGLWPFQIQGYNFLKDLPGGVANWSTGTGKTVLASALTAYHHQQNHYDICLWVVKPHNRINTQRMLKQFVGIDSVVIDGPPAKRAAMYREARGVLVLNYEKFRDDEQEITEMLDENRVFIVWDEMPTKLKNRQTKLYKSVVRSLFVQSNLTTDRPRVKWETQRPAELRQVMLSATPIELNPEDLYSCVRLLDPDERLGNVGNFRKTYVATYDYFNHKPETWRNLAAMGNKLAPIIHQVDKTSPDIAAQFPDVLEQIVEVDLTADQQTIYDRLMKKILEDGTANDISDSMMSKIGVAQMLLDHPLSVLRSAKKRELMVEELERAGFATPDGSQLAMDLVKIIGKEIFGRAGSAKLDALHDVLGGLEREEKGIIFTAFNASMLPLISEALTSWGYNHVVYKGGMSMKARQAAEDKFKSDPDCTLFLSSDAGSDSINLEVASMVVHYDLPWKWSTVIQRQNRAHRITSTHKTVRYYALLAPNTVEDRKQKIIATKAGYHDAIFKGAVAEQSDSMRLTKGDLTYILRGDQ